MHDMFCSLAVIACCRVHEATPRFLYTSEMNLTRALFLLPGVGVSNSTMHLGLATFLDPTGRRSTMSNDLSDRGEKRISANLIKVRTAKAPTRSKRDDRKRKKQRRAQRQTNPNLHKWYLDLACDNIRDTTRAINATWTLPRTTFATPPAP